MASREDRLLHPLRGAWTGQYNTADGEEKTNNPPPQKKPKKRALFGSGTESLSFLVRWWEGSEKGPWPASLTNGSPPARPAEGEECGNDLARSKRQLGKPGKAPAWEGRATGWSQLGLPPAVWPWVIHSLS